MTSGTWAGVREKVQELASLPGASKVFGYHGHGFALADPLSISELSELESRLGARLPDDYRDFLLEVGAGGAGPAYGIFPVRRTEDGEWHWQGDGGDMTDLDRLAIPFPTAAPNAERIAELKAERPEEDDFEDQDEDENDFDSAYEAWEERWAEVMWSNDRTVGAICLCHIGCAERRWLVISGPGRGHIWADARCDDVDLAPLHPADAPGKPLTFTTWYLEWLAEATQQAQASA